MKAGFQYFPENFMWSQGMMIVIEMARWGGSAMSEVDRVGKRLKDKVGDNEAWGSEWEKEARRVEAMGDAAAAENHPLSAAGHYLRAATCSIWRALRAAWPEENRTLPELPARCFRRGWGRCCPSTRNCRSSSGITAMRWMSDSRDSRRF